MGHNSTDVPVPTSSTRVSDLDPAFFQRFTPAEQECISRKISQLRDEGVEQDQAIARAINECAPEKARPRRSAASGRSGHRDEDKKKKRRNRAYRSVQLADGTWSILDIPVFAVHKDPRSGQVFDRAWLEGAVRQNAERRAAGFFPPLHVNHHGLDEVTPAGFFALRRVGRLAYEGREVDAIFADFLRVPAAVFDLIQRGRLPYRSVEILDVRRDAPEIDSIAIMAHDVPFFRFPNLTVDVATQPDAAPAALQRSEAPALCYRAVPPTGAAILFRFDSEDTDMDPQARTFQEADPLAGAREAMAKSIEDVQALLDGIKARLEEIMAELGGAAAPAAEPEMEPEMAPEGLMSAPAVDPARADAAALEAAKQDAAQVAAAAPPPPCATGDDDIRAQVAALQGQLTAMQRRQRNEATERQAMAELAALGYGEELRGHVRKHLAAGGEPAVRAFLGAIEAAGAQAPDGGLAATLGVGDRGRAELPEAVRAYEARGDVTLEEARRLSEVYGASPAWARKHDLKAYLAAQLGSPEEG